MYWGTQETPSSIKSIIWVTALTTLIVAVADQLFLQLLGLKGPQSWLALSWYGVRHYYIWQPITYMLVQEAAGQGILLSHLIALFVNMYMLWLIGSMVHERIGNQRFLTLYIAAGVFAGVVTLLAMPILGTYSAVAGPAAAILALCVVWTMYYPDSRITFLFLYPIQAKWLLGGVLGALSLLALSQGDLISLIFYLSGAFFGYLYGVIALNLEGPFDFSKNFDKKLGDFSQKVREKFSRGKTGKGDSKVVDISTGASRENDDAFIDAMLAKIAQHGEQSLSRYERQRLDGISARKAKKGRPK